MTDETTFPQAVNDLHDAIAALIDPRPIMDGNRTLWNDSIYIELRKAIYGHRAGVTRQPSEPQPPVWIDGLDLLVVIDNQTAKWQRNGIGPRHITVNRLHHIADRKWRPQDSDLITDIATRIKSWIKTYETLTAEERPKSLPNPCPRCSEKWSWRTVDGERVKQPALQVTTERCICLSCGATWAPSQFAFLARMLGYQKPEGVVV